MSASVTRDARAVEHLVQQPIRAAVDVGAGDDVVARSRAASSTQCVAAMPVANASAPHAAFQRRERRLEAPCASDCRCANSRTRPTRRRPAARTSRPHESAARPRPSAGRAPGRRGWRGCESACAARRRSPIQLSAVESSAWPKSAIKSSAFSMPQRQADHVVGDAEAPAVFGRATRSSSSPAAAR